MHFDSAGRAGFAQTQLPRLGDEVLGKTVVRFLFDFEKTGFGVDVAGRQQIALGPQPDLAIASGAGEVQQVVDQAHADALTARVRLDQEQTQLAHFLRGFDQEHTANRHAAPLGDPAVFMARIRVLDELGHDARHQGFKLLVEAVLMGVQHRVALDHPAHVTGAMRTDGKRLGFERLLSQ